MSSTTTMTHVVDARGGLKEIRFPRLMLEVMRGPDQRKQKTFQKERILIGTAEGADLRLTDPTVSAYHCALELDVEGCKLTDLGSKNGVVLFERRVVSVFVEPGDPVQLGATQLRIKDTQQTESRAIPDRTSLAGLIGGSVPMRLLYEQLARVAVSDAPVLIAGETGTGKELAAEAIVALGPRAKAPFVVVDCARHGTDLFESEVFGHEKGAFTGADSGMPGAFERANGGTVLLDQICELPLSMQPKLLGVLERKAVQPLGGEPRPIDVRVIATSRRPLEREINRGNFRSDLFYRLAAVQLTLPSLSERREDVPELVAHFCKELGLTQPMPAYVLEQLYAADYPGNVRELKSAVTRAVLGVMPARREAPVPDLDLDEQYWPQRERFDASLERRYLARLLEACDGNVSEVARRSGISRGQLYAMLQRHGLSAAKRR